MRIAAPAPARVLVEGLDIEEENEELLNEELCLTSSNDCGRRTQQYQAEAAALGEPDRRGQLLLPSSCFARSTQSA